MAENLSQTAKAAGSTASSTETRLRLWPGVAMLAIQWLVLLGTELFMPVGFVKFMVTFIAPMAATVLVIGWWLFASRLSWKDRMMVLAAFAVAALVTARVCKDTFPGTALLMYALPVVMTVWVGWLLVTYKASWPMRRLGLMGALVVAWTFFMLVRFDGIYGGMKPHFSWRLAPTAEERLLTELKEKPAEVQVPASAETAATKLVLAAGDWPAFRGANRDGRLTGVSIETDWSRSAPKELWRHRIGPGWSSFAVVGHHLFTQEQRGEDELTVCYHADTGAEIWKHADAIRFADVVAGPGPRATPTFDAGMIYAFGATGKLNCLDAATGKLVWSRDVVKDTGAKLPQWGLSSSPLVAEGIVSVFVGGPDGKSTAAYKIDAGEPAWTAGEGDLSYCSPQLAHIDGAAQILVSTNAGLSAFEPESGKVLWHHSWPQKDLARIVQPAVVDGTDLLLGTGMGIGTRRLHVAHHEEQWTASEVWTSRAIKPYFNDMVLYDGHAYGFDTSVFMCIDLAKGQAGWKTRGYDDGQVLLLADQGLLLILSEQGEVALVEANPKVHEELAKFKALEGKTWNHPVVAHGKLFVRNAEEVACFQLTEKVAEVARGE